jgi:glucose-6-phosphate isomerase
MARYEDADWRDSMRIRYDYTNMMAEVVSEKRGPTEAELDEMGFRVSAGLDVLRMRRSPKDLTWVNLPNQQEMALDVLSFAREVEGVYDDVVVLGIGGSALGVTALKTALLPFNSSCSITWIRTGSCPR